MGSLDRKLPNSLIIRIMLTFHFPSLCTALEFRCLNRFHESSYIFFLFTFFFLFSLLIGNQASVTGAEQTTNLCMLYFNH